MSSSINRCESSCSLFGNDLIYGWNDNTCHDHCDDLTKYY